MGPLIQWQKLIKKDLNRRLIYVSGHFFFLYMSECLNSGGGGEKPEIESPTYQA